MAEQQSAMDGFLSLIFRCAKLVSVVVIVVGIITLIGSLAAAAFSVPRQVPPAKPFVAPNAAEYQQAIASQQTRPAAPSNAARQDPAQTVTQYQTVESRFQAVTKRFDADSPRLDSIFDQLEFDVQTALIPAIDQFLQSLDLKRVNSGQAAAWYLQRFQAEWRQAAKRVQQEADDRRFAAAEAAARQQLMLTLAGGSGAALMSFLFLPLLIRVEQNTRRSLELQAALRMDRARESLERSGDDEN